MCSSGRPISVKAQSVFRIIIPNQFIRKHSSTVIPFYIYFVGFFHLYINYILFNTFVIITKLYKNIFNILNPMNLHNFEKYINFLIFYFYDKPKNLINIYIFLHKIVHKILFPYDK
jgi:hypothetical protein